MKGPHTKWTASTCKHPHSYRVKVTVGVGVRVRGVRYLQRLRPDWFSKTSIRRCCELRRGPLGTRSSHALQLLHVDNQSINKMENGVVKLDFKVGQGDYFRTARSKGEFPGFKDM